jgi:hypothetical protein
MFWALSLNLSLKMDCGRLLYKFNYGLFFYYATQVLFSDRFKRKVAFKGAEKYYGT